MIASRLYGWVKFSDSEFLSTQMACSVWSWPVCLAEEVMAWILEIVKVGSVMCWLKSFGQCLLLLD